jgi:hypothetical protein
MRTTRFWNNLHRVPSESSLRFKEFHTASVQLATRKMTVNQNIYFGEECTRLVHYWAAEKINMAGHI